MRNHDPEPRFALPLPAVLPVLDPLFRPAASPGGRSSSTRATPGGRSGSASRSSSGTARSRASRPTCCPADAPGAADDNFRMLERLVKLALWARGGFRIHLDAPAELVERLRRALPRHRHRTLRLRDRRRARLRSPDRGRGHQDAAAGALEHRGSRRAPRGLPHRLRPGRQRSQGGGAHRRPRRLERGDGVGSRTTSPTRTTTGAGSWTRCGAPPSTSRASTPSAAAPRASTSTTR